VDKQQVKILFNVLGILLSFLISISIEVRNMNYLYSSIFFSLITLEFRAHWCWGYHTPSFDDFSKSNCVENYAE